MGGDFSGDHGLDVLDLSQSTGRKQPQMNDHDMQRLALDVELDLQHPALLKRVVRDVFMAVRLNGPTAQERIAVLAVAGAGIGLVDDMVVLGRQGLRLPHLGPMVKAPSELVIERPHLLQTHHIGVQAGHSTGHVVNFKPAAPTQPERQTPPKPQT